MKSYMKILFYVLIALWGSVMGVNAIVQAYTPTAKWPYLYQEFRPGVVYFSDNQKTKQMELNIHLQHCTLHYLNGDNIQQSDPRDIAKVEIGQDVFIFMNGELVRLVKADDNNALVKLIKVDMETLAKGGTGAYGMSADVSATQQLSSYQIQGTANLSHAQMKIEKGDGKDLPLVEEYYIILGAKIIEATRKDIEKSLTEVGKAKLKIFVKQNKIKWKDEASLVKLLNFYKD